MCDSAAQQSPAAGRSSEGVESESATAGRTSTAAVTLVMQARVGEDDAEDFERWQQQLSNALGSFPGYLMAKRWRRLRRSRSTGR